MEYRNSYSQNGEDLKVLNYFNGKRGTVLEIGANQGLFLSNSRLLIENGFTAYLLEPGETYADLEKLYKDGYPNVHLFNFGIGDKDEEVTFYESGAHVPNGTDSGLVSSTKYEETEKWRKAGVEFKETKVLLVTFKTFLELSGGAKFDFISIDAEGFDWNILQQINLNKVGCRVLCIEWNGDNNLRKQYTDYCKQFGLKEIHRNAENLIFAK